MNLTPLDIRRKEFDKGFRGYDPTEVDLFLKQVAQQLEEFQEDVRRAEERARDAEAKLVHYEKVELALQEALESARETSRSTAASAEEKARLIVQDANSAPRPSCATPSRSATACARTSCGCRRGRPRRQPACAAS